MHCYQRLRDLREDKDLSQGKISQLLKISQQHYSMYEMGKRELPMHHFVTLANSITYRLIILRDLQTSRASFIKTSKIAALMHCDFYFITSESRSSSEAMARHSTVSDAP